MGLKPWEFNKYDWKDFLLMQSGYYDRLANQERMIRRAVRVIISPWLKNTPTEFQLYGIHGDEKLKELLKEYNETNRMKVSEKSLAILKRFKDAEEKQKSKDN